MHLPTTYPLTNQTTAHDHHHRNPETTYKDSKLGWKEQRSPWSVLGFPTDRDSNAKNGNGTRTARDRDETVDDGSDVRLLLGV